jgi:hypothetical protein
MIKGILGIEKTFADKYLYSIVWIALAMKN